MKLKFKLFLLFLIFPILFCSTEPSKIKLMVISTVKGFYGYYIVDGETLTTFSASEDAYGIALYETEIEDPDYLEVSATTISGATSIEVKIYRDNKKVKSNYKEIYSPYDSTMIQLDYTIGEEEDNETSE